MADSVDEQLALAGVYAGALFGLAQQAGAVEIVRDELGEIAQLCAKQPDFGLFLASRSVSMDRRKASLEKLFRGKLHDLTLNTLLLLNDNDRAEIVPQMHAAFETHARAAANEMLCTAVSAVELDAGQREEVLRTARELTGKQPVMTWRVDPGILGGLVLQLGDVRYDYSTARQLRQTRRLLSERGERGLQIRVENA